MNTVILPLKARFIKEVGTRVYLRRYWDGGCKAGLSYHNAMLKLQDIMHPLVLGDREHLGGQPGDYPDEMWPTTCQGCGAPVPPGASRQVFNERLYDTQSGQPERGNLWYAHWLPLDYEWTDKADYYLYAMCPDGHIWNIDARASNCTMKDDRAHRCWTRSGDPETGNVDVGKSYYRSCQAGAGSILTHGGWHGFLRGGYFIQ